MKSEKRIVKTLAAFALICGFSVSVQAQLGSGWTPDGETYIPQTSSGCTITSISGGFEFSVPSGQGRAEQRGNNLPTTTTNQWQGFATLKSFPSGSNKICVHQVFGPAPSTPDLILDEATGGSTGIEIMSLEQGDAFEAAIQVGVQFQLNTIYDPVGNLITIYVNGSQTGTKTPNSGVHYNKYGQYVSSSGTGPATMDWVNIQSWAGGTTGGGGGNHFTITASAGSGGSISPTGNVVVNQGANQSFTITPNSGFNISSVTVDGANQGAINSFTFSNVQANHTISAAFSQQVSEGPFGGTPAAIPGTVQAENYDTGGQGVAYNVSSINGTDNGYRSDGVDLEVTSDTGGGVDLGWTTGGQFFKYTVNVATAGTYTVSFRIAAPAAVTDAFHLSNSSGTNLSGNVNLPATGGYQTWATVTANVTLPAGQQILTINQDNAGWNINYAAFQQQSSGEGPFGGTPAAIPGTVQAENYDTGGQGVAYNVTSVNGTDNGYRSDGVDLEVTSDTGGGVDLGWESPGQWFKYTVNVATAGTYTVSFRIAAPGAVTDAFHLADASGTNLSGNVNIPATGGYQTWATVTANVTLPAGQQILTLDQDNGGGVWNINYIAFQLQSSGEGPFGGTPAAIPGTVQAENYDTGGQGVAYNIGSINGTDNGYRSDGVDLEVTSDTGGGVDLGWTFGGDWFKYTVNVATAGTYTVSFRIAAPAAVTDAFHLADASGTNLSGNVNLPATGGYQTWTTVTANLTLSSRQQILTLDQDNGGWNINYMSFASNGSNRTLTGSSGDGWHALAISPAATGTFTATYDATPSASPENAVVGLSNGAATGFSNLGCIARFNPSGQIDAYNSTAYAAASSINYSANVSYHFEMDVNLTAHTYSIYVTPAGGSKTLVGSNYAFRSTANTMTSLNDWNLDVDPSNAGSLTATNLSP